MRWPWSKKKKPVVDWGCSCGRTYLSVAGFIVAVEGDTLRDADLVLKFLEDVKPLLIQDVDIEELLDGASHQARSHQGQRREAPPMNFTFRERRAAGPRCEKHSPINSYYQRTKDGRVTRGCLRCDSLKEKWELAIRRLDDRGRESLYMDMLLYGSATMEVTRDRRGDIEKVERLDPIAPPKETITWPPPKEERT